MASTTETYVAALKHHQSGDIEQAENLYREILRVDPQHADANHLLGVAAHQRNQNDRAVEYIGKAIQAKSSVPTYHSNLGAAFRALGHLDRAVESLRNAIHIDANYVEGHRNLSVLLSEQGNHAEASQHLQEAEKLQQAADNPATTGKDFIWQGIYQSFDEVPTRGGGHEGNNWATATFDQNKQLRANAKTYHTIPFDTHGHHSYLPMVAGIVSQQQENVRVLDFGGATGTAMLHLSAGLPERTPFELHVVETDSACRLGEELWADEKRVRFHRGISDVPRPIEVVQINSALQYVDDFRAVLQELCTFQARYFLLARLSAGDIPTYATAQMNLWNDVVAYQFINVDELIETMNSNGYRLLSKSVEAPVYDQSNFPAEYRMHRACNILFGLEPNVTQFGSTAVVSSEGTE